MGAMHWCTWGKLKAREKYKYIRDAQDTIELLRTIKDIC